MKPGRKEPMLCEFIFMKLKKQAKPIHSGRSHICVILKKRGLDLSSGYFVRIYENGILMIYILVYYYVILQLKKKEMKDFCFIYIKYQRKKKKMDSSLAILPPK